MSRREEVEKEIEYMLDSPAHQIEECCEQLMSRARTLADEVDAITAERDSLARRINPDGAPVDVADLCLEIDTVADEVDAITAGRDEWERRCQNLVEAMRYHGYSAESLARIAEGKS